MLLLRESTVDFNDLWKTVANEPVHHFLHYVRIAMVDLLVFY